MIIVFEQILEKSIKDRFAKIETLNITINYFKRFENLKKW